MKVKIRLGDSFWQLSQLFNIPLVLLLDSNRNVNPNSLQIGQEINIPGFVSVNVQIRPGDSFWRIAIERGISVELLYALNPTVNPNQLRPGQIIQAPLRVTWMVVEGNRNYTYEAFIQDINRLIGVYPFIRLNIVGNSVMGKNLYELRLGRGTKKVHANGSFHAQEWITTPVIMRFLNAYALSLTNQQPIRGLYTLPLYNATDLSLVPMVNPDGVNLVIQGANAAGAYRDSVLAINGGRTDFSPWKANIRGVDLNNQYPAKWQTEANRKPKQPAPADFPGTAPLTEPESIAMANLTRTRAFDRALAFHTQGKVIYWGFEGLEPPESETLVNEFSRVSGYTPIRYIDSFAGYKDWFIQDFRRPGFTVELGLGRNPLPLTQFNEIYEESLGILLASLYM
ncbi:M14 family metallopeptidase [Bacillus horti]|uniref:G-D-glutamyl-meso-diaminopimelate peptidase n=1 Tax=Caldalkalibacillus horti TaxID=77523 RepID=A0ABT9VXW0_9BACI|nr:M14 family metallopeptidase [Bacillus horti]MDQ0165809.1 g-D-glutamyl-meso-diaminopimelate peptidase [Bacillus horti]